MAKKVNFPNWEKFLQENCKQTGEIEIIMGISMVSSEKAPNHYQNGPIFASFCEEVLKIHKELQSSGRTLSLTVVLTGILHRHNIAIQDNISLKAALEKAREKDNEWRNGSISRTEWKGCHHAGLLNGHYSIMQEIFQEEMPFQVRTLDEWIFENGEKTQIAEESFAKVKSLYDDKEKPALRQAIQQAAQEKVRRELLPRFNSAYERLEQNINLNTGDASSTIGQIQKAVNEIMNQEKMVDNKVFLTDDDKKAIDKIQTFKPGGKSAKTKQEHLKNIIPVARHLFEKVQGTFLASAKDYLLEEASTVFFFDLLGNQSIGKSEEEKKQLASQSKCLMTYKGDMNPAFAQVCSEFNAILPYLPYQVRSAKNLQQENKLTVARAGKKPISQEEVNDPVPVSTGMMGEKAVPSLLIPNKSIESQSAINSNSSASPDLSPSHYVVNEFKHLSPPQQKKALEKMQNAYTAAQQRQILNDAVAQYLQDIQPMITKGISEVLSRLLSQSHPMLLEAGATIAPPLPPEEGGLVNSSPQHEVLSASPQAEKTLPSQSFFNHDSSSSGSISPDVMNNGPFELEA